MGRISGGLVWGGGHGWKMPLVLLFLLELTSAIIPHPHHHHHPHSHHHHHGWHKKLRLLEFYGDGRTAADLSYPAAYVELKYPVLRHPRHNTLPHPHYATHHYHHHPPPHIEDGPPFPPSELEWRSGPIDEEVGGVVDGPPPSTDGHHGTPNKIVTYTKTIILEKGPDGVRKREEWEPPTVEHLNGGPPSNDQHFDTYESTSGGGGSGYGPPSGPSSPPYDIVLPHGGDDDEGGYHSGGPSSSSGGGGGYSSSGYGNHVESGTKKHSSSSSGVSSHPNSLARDGGGGGYGPPSFSAPLVENLGEIVKEEGGGGGGYLGGKNEPPTVRVQHQEKVIKNVALNEYIWVRREEGTTNIRLTLDPVRRSTYFLDDVALGRRIHVVSRERICVRGGGKDGGKASGSGCNVPPPPTPALSSGGSGWGREDGNLIRWDFVRINHGQYWIQQSGGSNLCLQPGPSFTRPRFVEMRPCDLYEATQLWELGTVTPSSSDNYSKGAWPN